MARAGDGERIWLMSITVLRLMIWIPAFAGTSGFGGLQAKIIQT